MAEKEKKASKKSAIVQAAEAIGSAAGKIAALAGVTPESSPAPKAARKEKLAPPGAVERAG